MTLSRSGNGYDVATKVECIEPREVKYSGMVFKLSEIPADLLETMKQPKRHTLKYDVISEGALLCNAPTGQQLHYNRLFNNNVYTHDTGLQAEFRKRGEKMFNDGNFSFENVTPVTIMTEMMGMEEIRLKRFNKKNR